ncbi:MAG: hypothetical protein MZV63_39105 [Marinilabiliales bacterium]|nr:hypothetical protein [Marinilabiliales bacterium]
MSGPLTPAQKNRIKLRQDGILDLTGGAFRPSPDLGLCRSRQRPCHCRLNRSMTIR